MGALSLQRLKDKHRTLLLCSCWQESLTAHTLRLWLTSKNIQQEEHKAPVPKTTLFYPNDLCSVCSFLCEKGIISYLYPLFVRVLCWRPCIFIVVEPGALLGPAGVVVGRSHDLIRCDLSWFHSQRVAAVKVWSQEGGKEQMEGGGNILSSDHCKHLSFPRLFFHPQEPELVSREGDTTRQALSAAGWKVTAHQRRFTKSFLFLSLYFFNGRRMEVFPLRRKNVFIKHSAWAKFTSVLGVKVTFPTVLSPTNRIHSPFSPWTVYLFCTLWLSLDSVSWGSLGVVRICVLGPYITLNGQTTHRRRGFPVCVDTGRAFWGILGFVVKYSSGSGHGQSL